MLAFGVLGPLSVERDGHAVPLKGPKLRVLLATLLLRANSVVLLPTIIDRLWDGVPPPAGRTSVPMYVLRLRRALGEDDDAVIETRPDGYLLRIRPQALDLTRFRDAVRSARTADGAGELALLTEALRCWRGPALQDVPSQSLHRDDVPALAEELQEARERFFDACLALGRAREIIGDLVRATEEQPWHEAYWAQLVTALSRTGRRADALRTYREIRGRFVDELGVEPGTRLQLAHQAALTVDIPDAAPPVIAQLPGDLRRFIGRAAAIKHLDRLTAGDERNIVISGPPGVGKTSLAVHVAHRWADRFPDGQLHVNLQGFAAHPPLSPSAALLRLLGTLGFGRDRVPADLDEQSALLRSALTGRRMVLVLDNAADADQVRPLLPGAPGCVALITSRHDLRGLVVNPGAQVVRLDVLDEAEARAVLLDLVGPVRAQAEPAALRELAATCGHLPLALRIAGANLAADPGCSVASYVLELTSRGRLAALAIDGDDQSAVRAAFDQSYLRLSGADQTLFRLLGTAPGPDIGVPAAAALAGVDVFDARRALDRLAAAGLLLRTDTGRYGFHDLIREYAADRARGEDTDTAHTALVTHYLDRATAAARLAFPVPAVRDAPPDPALTEPDAVRWLDDELYNLLAAVTWAATRPDAQRLAWRMVAVLLGYLRARGHTGEAVSTLVAALRAAVTAGNTEARLSLLNLLGQIFYNLSEWERAAEHHEQMLAIAQELGDPDAEADALHNIGRQVLQLGRPAAALTYSRRSLQICRATGNTELEVQALNSNGLGNLYLGAPLVALDHHEQALSLARELDHRELVHRSLNGRGIAHWALGRLDASAADHDQVLAYCRHAGQRIGELASLACLAEVHLDAGRLDRAAEFADEALKLSGELAERRTQTNMIMVIAAIHERRGEPGSARKRFEESLELARDIGFGYGEGASLLGLATAHRTAGDPATAHTLAAEALDLLRGNRQLLLEADVLTELAHTLLALGDPATAARTATEAVEIAARQGRQLAEHRARQALSASASTPNK
ncbi:hypothetical protein UK23_39470 [Lentzea aerocolonigenes]|uniref:OmpR/PhoB-type domain-containing protein n=1 Tax=Lentzea aerocolonigenes TaxID=68170 RepID=A0A0F0GEI3_LENAE|nr:BTAD domain-containing putative transcriptional regulator [Lentzea aerocolonigenes]KJK41954.1 hypothetical protein UK23_39470 [Lentzea aerocolonigenes]